MLIVVLVLVLVLVLVVVVVGGYVADGKVGLALVARVTAAQKVEHDRDDNERKAEYEHGDERRLDEHFLPFVETNNLFKNSLSKTDLNTRSELCYNNGTINLPQGSSQRPQKALSAVELLCLRKCTKI